MLLFNIWRHGLRPNLLKKIFGGIYFACTKLYTVAYMEFPVDQIIGKSSDAKFSGWAE